jgi:hypothetical protein
MKIRLLKLFIVAAFPVFAAGVFFISGDSKIKAQDKEAAKKKIEILEKVAGYKTWKQAVKADEENSFSIVGDASGFG